MANQYRPMRPEVYQPLGYVFGAHYSGFELTKFGMVERFFLFAETPNLDAGKLQQFSSASFEFANGNKSTSLPNGLFMCVHCFPVAITTDLDPELARIISESEPAKHFAAAEMPVVFDITDGSLNYFRKTPFWGAAYFAGFRREIEKNLR